MDEKKQTFKAGESFIFKIVILLNELHGVSFGCVRERWPDGGASVPKPSLEDGNT